MPIEATERKVTYKRRLKQGFCPRCGAKKRKTEKFKYCGDCREYFRSYNEEISVQINKKRKAKYDQRKKNNQCPRCGIKLGKKYTKTICPECLGKQYGYNYGKIKPAKAKKPGTPGR